MREPITSAYTSQKETVLKCAGLNRLCYRKLLDDIFKEVNARNKMEGGPKGVAIHKNSLAVCSPEYGVKIYSFHENLSDRCII